MRKLFITIMLAMPLFGMAQNDGGWVNPNVTVTTEEPEAKPAKEKKKKDKKSNEPTAPKKKKKKEPKVVVSELTPDNPDYKYLVEDAVQVVDGYVTWVLDFDAPGKDAKQLYEEMLAYLQAMTKGENQLEGSNVSLVNPSQHKIVAHICEWLTFKSSFFMMDRAEMDYHLFVDCTAGHVKVTMARINYKYHEGKDRELLKAEEQITDKAAVNKKRTRLYPITGKFRRKTIDRKDELFEDIRKQILIGKIE